MEEDKLLNFVIGKDKSPIIKVIGVGGGGGNAVNHMYRQGIHDVSFVICNTDYQALEDSPIETKIFLGEGLGAGNKPEVACKAAIDALPKIEQVLKENTKMVFVTAGMGGGTGTGAAPIVAKAAKDLEILTVGIVTIPFMFEGKKKIEQALAGVEEMSMHVDALLVINNEKLKEIYPDLKLSNAFAKADDVLASAAKGISEIITVSGYINVDFADVDTTMRNGGVAIMNSGRGSGENRITKAIENALDSPLLNNNNIRNAKKILLNLYTSRSNEIEMDNVGEIDAFMEMMGDDIEVIWGATFDEELGDEVKITIIATGFGIGNFASDKISEKKNVVFINKNTGETKKTESPTSQSSRAGSEGGYTVRTGTHQPTTEDNKLGHRYNEYYGDSRKNKPEHPAVSSQELEDDEEYLDELLNTSAFKRKQSGQGAKPFRPSNISKMKLDDENKLKDQNGFLHDSVD